MITALSVAGALAHGISVVALADKADFANHASNIYAQAKTRYETNPKDDEAAWQFGRACFDWADYATSSRQREKIAKEGMAACRQLVERNPNSVQGFYYLAMDLGQLAQTKSIGALKIVSQMETNFKIALRLDAAFDYAGPERNLGLLYHQTPGWPLSIGSKTKARQYLQDALKRAPDYPENLLNLIEAEWQWSERNNVQNDLNKLDALWPAAKAKFTGDEWASSWVDWESRRDAMKKKLAARTTGSPRGGSGD